MANFKLQASDSFCVEAETFEQVIELIERFRSQIAPVIYDDVAALPARAAQKPAKAAKPNDDERALAKRYKAKFGKRFFHDASSGKSRIESLKEALGE